jgi:hypothetical protein
MKAYLIDPKERSITQVEHDDSDYKNISRAIDCDYFATIDINEHGDTIYVDDEGLLIQDVKYMFCLDGNPNNIYAGKGLVLGTDEEGESCEPTITLDDVKKRVTKYFTII